MRIFFEAGSRRFRHAKLVRSTCCTFTIKGRDVLSEDGKSFDRIVDSKDDEGRDTSVIQVFEKQ